MLGVLHGKFNCTEISKINVISNIKLLQNVVKPGQKVYFMFSHGDFPWFSRDVLRILTNV